MRIMVLGGGSNQIDLIRKAQQMGYEVVLIDYLTDCPGKDIADIHLLVSTFDVDAVISAAREYNVDAIVTAGTDQPVLTAALASEAVGLSCYINSTVARGVTNKIVMKGIFKQNNIPTVDYRLIKSDFDDTDIEGLLFPAVLKPVDSQGQRGIFLVDNTYEVRERIEETLSHSREDTVLLEEYYENDEITVNGWVHEGQVTIISVVDRVTIRRDEHIGICLCHNFPSMHLAQYNDDIDRITKQIVKAFDIQNGPLYFQYLVGKDGIKVNEIAMRIGGAYEGITIPIIAQIDILGMLLDNVKGIDIDSVSLQKYSLDRNRVCLSTQLFFCNAGTIAYMTPIKEVQSIPCVETAYYEYKVGDTIKSLINATARAGYIIVHGDSFGGMIDNVNMVFDRIKILNVDDDNLVIKYTDYNDKYVFAPEPRKLS